MTVHEFLDWHRFAAVHPFPAEIADLHGAQLIATLININRHPDKSEPADARNFLILRGREGRFEERDDDGGFANKPRWGGR